MTHGDTLRRLFAYATPYRGRMFWAVLGMIVYAVGSAASRISSSRSSTASCQAAGRRRIAWAIVVVYLLKGIGSYVSSYLMADVGQRVVMDLGTGCTATSSSVRRASSRTGRPGRLLSRINNDVGQVQQAVSETVGDLARETLAPGRYAALCSTTTRG
jgi:ABC-type multidrug transport system fused ATPase/permease subunit